MTANVIMDVYPGRPFPVAVVNFSKLDLHLLKHRKAGKVANGPDEIVHIKDDRYSYLYGKHVNNSDSSVNAAHYESISERSELMAKLEFVNKRDKDALKKVSREEIQLHAKYEQQRSTILKLFT